MKKMILILAIFALPFGAFAESTPDSQQRYTTQEQISVVEFEAYDVVKSTMQAKDVLVLKRVEPISADPIDQNKSLNYKKSKDIISVRAYIRSLQMKRKETLMS